MEDTKSLLMMVLHKIFQNHPKTIEDTFQLIHSFNNGKIEKKNYEKTLRSICDLMNDELPAPILFYILTLVDMPQDFGFQSALVEKMKKTHDFLPELNVRPHLLEYLNNVKPSSISKISTLGVQEQEKKENWQTVLSSKKTSEAVNTKFLKPMSKSSKNRSKKVNSKISGSPDHLLDICSDYVVRNYDELKAMYKQKQTSAWRLINCNMFNGRLEECYSVIQDLNKKLKLLREIESNNISYEMLFDEYKHSAVCKRNDSTIEKDLFQLPEQYENMIDSLFYKN